jgi:ketosteroid isomerase-like protein
MQLETIDKPEEAGDFQAIRSLVDAYAHFADRRDADGQMALFTEDCRLLVFYEVRSTEPSQSYHGRAALASVFDALNAYEATTHCNGQSSISVRGDEATGESYCLAHHVTRKESGAELMVASIRYLDTITRTSAAWRFAERKLMVDWIDADVEQLHLEEISQPAVEPCGSQLRPHRRALRDTQTEPINGSRSLSAICRV